MMKTDITYDDLNELVFDYDGVVAVYLSAVWCNPCKIFSPILTEWSDMNFVDVLKIDVDQDLSRTAEKFDVRGVPTLLLFKGGELVDRCTGGQTLEFLDDFFGV